MTDTDNHTNPRWVLDKILNGDIDRHRGRYYIHKPIGGVWTPQLDSDVHDTVIDLARQDLVTLHPNGAVTANPQPAPTRRKAGPTPRLAEPLEPHRATIIACIRAGFTYRETADHIGATRSEVIRACNRWNTRPTLGKKRRQTPTEAAA